MSGIVETEFGFHIIKTVDKKSYGKNSYESLKDSLSKSIREQKLQKEVAAYLNKLKERAKIEKNL
jgi:peptidyl-prolyl cis-trans isomerase C